MIRFDDVHAIKLIAAVCQVQFVPTLHHCIARYNSRDQLMGGVLFTDFMGGSLQIHTAGFAPRWADKSLLYLTFNYPFVQIKCKKLVGLVPEWNVRARNLNLHLGFKIEYLVEDIFSHKNAPNGMYIMSMRREDCRFLNMKVPHIELAPPERVNRIDLPLSIVDHTQMVRH
jgi:hypothetical protein